MYFSKQTANCWSAHVICWAFSEKKNFIWYCHLLVTKQNDFFKTRQFPAICSIKRSYFTWLCCTSMLLPKSYATQPCLRRSDVLLKCLLEEHSWHSVSWQIWKDIQRHSARQRCKHIVMLDTEMFKKLQPYKTVSCVPSTINLPLTSVLGCRVSAMRSRALKIGK